MSAEMASKPWMPFEGKAELFMFAIVRLVLKFPQFWAVVLAE